MKRTPDIDLVRRCVRSRICAGCPYRTAGTKRVPPSTALPCEAACPVFVELRKLADVARLRDPMINPNDRALKRLIEQIARREPARGGHMRLHGRRLESILRELFR